MSIQFILDFYDSFTLLGSLVLFMIFMQHQHVDVLGIPRGKQCKYLADVSNEMCLLFEGGATVKTGKFCTPVS